MGMLLFASLAAQAQAEVPPVTVTQGLLLLIAIIAIFGVEVYATGFVAKKLDIFDANYGKALWAALLKNVLFGAAAYLLNNYLMQVPEVPTLVLVGAVTPVVVYKLVFQSTVGQAIKLWIAVLVVEVAVGFALVYGAMSLGAWLNQKFNLTM
jgi:hypothetical protein